MDGPAAMDGMDGMDAAAWLRLLQLSSPALPIGAFAYSQGLEAAVTAGDVVDEVSAGAWIAGLLRHALARLDVPVFARLHDAWQRKNDGDVRRWTFHLCASRGSAELLAEDRRLGSALARVLHTLGIPEAQRFEADPHATQLTLFALAAVHFALPLPAAAHAFLFTWCENQVTAAVRLVPLGQSAGLRLVSALLPLIPEAVATGLSLADEDIGATTPGHALLSALHETQYSRLFRS